MRVTDTMMFSYLHKNLSIIQSKLFAQQQKITVGREIVTPSDDPVGIYHSLSARTAINKNEQFQNNITGALSWLETSESTMNQMYDLLSELEIIANNAANDTLSENERHSLALEINQKLEDLLQYSKTKFDGKYIFGGVNLNTTPFTTSNQIIDENFTAQLNNPVDLNHVHLKKGSVVVTDMAGEVTFSEGVDYEINYEDGTITVLNDTMPEGTMYRISYQTESCCEIEANPDGLSGAISRQIGEDVKIDINVSGEDLFLGSQPLFDLLIDLRNGVERNDISEIKNLAASIQQAKEAVGVLNSETGAKINRLTLAINFLENENTNLQKYKSEYEDLDMTEALTKYQSLNLAYETILLTSSEIMKTSLMNYF